MPPRKRIETDEPTAMVNPDWNPPQPLLRRGQLVHLILNGRTLQYREILDWDDRFLKIRSDLSVAPQTEIVLIPWNQVEALGLTDER